MTLHQFSWWLTVLAWRPLWNCDVGIFVFSCFSAATRRHAQGALVACFVMAAAFGWKGPLYSQKLRRTSQFCYSFLLRLEGVHRRVAARCCRLRVQLTWWLWSCDAWGGFWLGDDCCAAINERPWKSLDVGMEGFSYAYLLGKLGECKMWEFVIMESFPSWNDLVGWLSLREWNGPDNSISPSRLSHRLTSNRDRQFKLPVA